MGLGQWEFVCAGEIVLARSAFVEMRPWIVIDTQAGPKERLGSWPGVAGLEELARVPIVWRFVGMMEVVRQVGSVQTVGAQKPLVDRLELDRLSGSKRVVGAQFAVREPVVGQSVGHVGVGRFVELELSVEPQTVVWEPFVGLRVVVEEVVEQRGSPSVLCERPSDIRAGSRLPTRPVGDIAGRGTRMVRAAQARRKRCLAAPRGRC